MQMFTCNLEYKQELKGLHEFRPLTVTVCFLKYQPTKLATKGKFESVHLHVSVYFCCVQGVVLKAFQQ